MCNSHDIVCLREQWLLPTESGLLSNIHSDFYGLGSSAVDITADILVGRPYGGTAILYRKSLCNVVNILPNFNNCISGIKIYTVNGPTLLLTIYMPTEYNDEDSLERYIDVCANLNAIVVDSDAPHVMIIGDFNCQWGARFFNVLEHFMIDNNLIMSDVTLRSSDTDVFTHCSDNGSNTTWIDPVLCSHVMNNNLDNMEVLYDFICSDHRSLTLKLNCSITETVASNFDAVLHSVASPDWTRVDSYVSNLYTADLDHRLSALVFPDS
jgi:hypothetical protein